MNMQTPLLAERYAELVDIVDRACSGGVPGRETAQRYTICRQALLQEVDRARLPGFLIQCVSIDRFVDFITLFHPEARARRAFLAQQLNIAQAIPRSSTMIDIFDAPL